jgi:hypothetical protein
MSNQSPTVTSPARRAIRTPWSPAQLIVGAIGAFFIVLGVLALSEAGISAWTSPRTTVWGFGHTPLMAAVEIALGFSVILAAPYPFSARGTLLGFGVLMAIFGMVTILDPSAFRETLGVNTLTGWLYLGTGLGAAVMGSSVPLSE